MYDLSALRSGASERGPYPQPSQYVFNSDFRTPLDVLLTRVLNVYRSLLREHVYEVPSPLSEVAQ